MPKAEPQTNPRKVRSARPPVAKQPAPAIPSITVQSLPNDLPAAAWECLFRVALERLRQCKPRWAAITQQEALDLSQTWRVCGLARGGTLEAERWLMEAYQFMQRPLPNKGRPPLEPSPEFLLSKYERLRDGLQELRRAKRKDNPKDADRFYRERLQELVRQLGPVWSDDKPLFKASEIPITDEMIHDARYEIPSEAARLIIAALWGNRSSQHLKAELKPRRKTPPNPLRQWQQAIRSPLK